MKKVIMIVIILFMCSCKYDEYKMPEDVYIKLNSNIFEVYDQNIIINDLIKKSNVKILNKNEKINTNKLGEFAKTIKYKYKKRKYKYNVEYFIKDMKEPIFLSASEYRVITVGDDINLCDNLNFADNYDNDVKCSIEGNYDINTVGEYKLKYVLKDKENNKNEREFVLSVKDKDYKSNNTSNNYQMDRIPFSKAISKYKTKDTMIGIDVSYWQQNIDFKKVKEAGCEFVIIRLGVNSDIDKTIDPDSFYEKNIKLAKEAGLKVGVYVYTSAITAKISKEHAKWVIKILDKQKLDFPIAFDWENWSKFRSYKISTYDLTNSFISFKNEIEKHGYKAMLYSSKNYLEKIWMFNDKYDVWLAHYTNETNYEGKYIMWQMGNTGRIDGITGDVDIDIYYKE